VSELHWYTRQLCSCWYLFCFGGKEIVTKCIAAYKGTERVTQFMTGTVRVGLLVLSVRIEGLDNFGEQIDIVNFDSFGQLKSC